MKPRKFVSIAPIRVDNGSNSYVGAMAVADDGTAWNLIFDALNVRSRHGGWYWAPILALPDDESEGAKLPGYVTPIPFKG